MNDPGNTFLRKRLRRAGHDYASSGIYFVTLCVQHMEQRFGGIVDAQVMLNDAGEMIASTWEANATRYAGIELDEYVVMPNHLHAIVLLGTDPHHPSSDVSLSQIVQTFKSQSTVNYVRGVKSGAYPAFDRVLWQRGFHDRIIRSDREFEAARRYIDENPARAELHLQGSDGWW